MMRLIDADNLKPDAQWEFFYNCYFAYSISQIDDAPTVQAVPIEVLDKIREEIEEQVLESLSDGGDDWFTAEKINECLEIIDKRKVESEG